jgi:asparagine synthase (glutamine-hydrolysing)
MCGIAGVLGIERCEALSMAGRMLETLHHRGPDSHRLEAVSRAGYHPVALAFARLRIIDLSPLADQPMHLNEREGSPGTAIVFNGEIYNFRELRRDLVKLGHDFRTESDTEVILHAHRQWGIEAIERIWGMFAWALVDGESGTVWLCRDRLGIKPLYLASPPSGGLLFASEVRALLAAQHPEVTPRIDSAALESYFAQGAVYGLQSLIRGVSLLGPGESLELDWRGVPKRRHTYWQLHATEGSESRSGAVARLGSTLREVVRQHLVSDVPLGLFLSGGVDSSALAALAMEVGNNGVRSVCVGFDQPAFDETRESARIARLLGTQHQNLRLDGKMVGDDVGEVFSAADQPTVDGFNTFFISRITRQAGLTVALSGLGGDELFGGYATFRDLPRALSLARALRLLGPLRVQLSRFGAKVPFRSMAKVSELLRRSGLTSAYLLRRELFLPEDRRSLHALPEDSDPLVGIPLFELERLEAAAVASDQLTAISNLELSAYLRHMLLRDGDNFSMAVSLELRVPLLDHRVVEAAFRMPGAWKRADSRAKPILQDAVGKSMSALRLRRSKRGFTFPWKQWLLGPLTTSAEAAIHARETWNGLDILPSGPVDVWRRFRQGDRRVSALQVIALWMLAEYAQRHRLSR